MGSKQAGGARLVGVALAFVVALGAGAWWWLAGEAESSAPSALRAPAAGAPPKGALPAPSERERAAPEQLAVDTLSAAVPGAQQAAPAVLAAADAPLMLDVRHAHGPPAAYGVVAVYTQHDALLAHGLLDAQGRWEHAGFDAPVELYIAGCSAEFGRLSLERGRGAHELVLPEGGWVSGRVLVDGAAPDEPFALRLSGMTPTRELPDSASGIPRLALHHGGAEYDTTALTQPGGVFLVSGFPADSKVRVGAASEVYERVKELSSPSPVSVPFDEYVLALRRQPVIRGRLLHADGSPAAGAAFQLTQQVTRGPPVDAKFQPLGTTESRGASADDAGVFQVPISEGVEHCRCVDSATGETVDENACGPLELVVSVAATSSAGESIEVERRVREVDRDVDFGDLWMERVGTHTLRVLDSGGAPIQNARVELAGSNEMRAWMAGASLFSDADGLMSFLAGDADLGAATVRAALHEPVRVELPDPPRVAPLDVVLPSATLLSLHVRWPPSWSTERVGTWYVELRGAAPLLRSEEGKATTSGTPVAEAGPHASGAMSAKYPGTPGELVALERTASGDSITLDDLRADTPYHLRLHSRPTHAQQDPDAPGDITFWELDGVSLQRGEQRVLEVDLSALATDPLDGDG